MAKIIIPFPLRKHTDNQSEVDTSAPNLADAMDNLWGSYPELKATLDDSALLSVFVDNKLIDGDAAAWRDVSLGNDAEIALIIPIAGG